jgi:HEAT repeat protein
VSDAPRERLLEPLRRLGRGARALFAQTTSTAAAAGRAAARRLTPDPAAPRPAPLVARFGALTARLTHLEEVLDGRPGELGERVRACARLVAETADLWRAAEDEGGDGSALADPQHPAAPAVRRALLALDAATVPGRVPRRALAALTHPRREVRLLALEHLGDAPGAAALPVLMALYRGADAVERRAIVAAARRLGPVAAGSPLLAAALADEDATVRLQAGAAAGPAGPRPELDLLATADPSPAVRRWTVRVLLASGAARRSLRVAQALRDPDPGVRLEAVRGAGRSGDPGAVLALIRALGDPDAALAAAAAGALGALGLDVSGFDPTAPVGARLAQGRRLRGEWARRRFGAPGAAPPPAGDDAELADPLGAEFLVTPAEGARGG